MAACLSWASKVSRRRYSDSRKASSNPSLPEATAVSVRLASPRGPVDRHLRAPAEGGSASKLSAHDGQKLLWMREDLLENAALRAVLVPGGVSFTDRFCLVLEEVAWFLGGSGDEMDATRGATNRATAEQPSSLALRFRDPLIVHIDRRGKRGERDEVLQQDQKILLVLSL
eukprot:CAMPEP_0171528642 /NCGR_PEP_ID=MMETSP0959-20130129/11812_1 /TAXON_ID=87120 /ORGANISM="Aurantiochytrium limacinum, Strain ATCCMYA-1381" /LENGTH=170 /DNA_ID=CAMNT_0012070699 /DNA_START=309 /DNA_END=822 /DNA_ORIENTATION=+